VKSENGFAFFVISLGNEPVMPEIRQGFFIAYD